MTTNIGTSGRTIILPESAKEKLWRKIREEPLVPFGAAVTTGALIMALVKMRRRESRSMNHWLRFRVIAQGFTIAALVGGSYLVGGRKETKPAEEQFAERAEAERVKERAGFEERMKIAEETHALEESARAGPVGSGSAGSSGWGVFGLGQAKTSAAPEASSTSAVPPNSVSSQVPPSTEALAEAPSSPTKPSSGGSIWSWFGRGGSSTGSSSGSQKV